MSNLTSTAKTVHAVKPGYRMRSLCGNMQNTASKHLTNALVDCPECLAAGAVTAAAEVATAPHLTFAEQVEAGHPNPMPCACWMAGRSALAVAYRRDQVMHADAFREGAQCAFEEIYDI